MGWVLGPIALIACAYITYYSAVLLSDCYRSPEPVRGKRNYVHLYMDAVRPCLGPGNLALCGKELHDSLCINSCHGHHVRGAQQLAPLEGPRCKLQPRWDDVTGDVWPRQVVLAQLLGLEIGTFVSIVAAIMSFTYFFVVPTCA
ncbi:amino acid permease 1 [Triticum aestivum]|uniref:amino acid permease 1 n=1 Tax=Triticum aestivum TaxID=4565 RepID=UPI001D006414|nr:amino acid permease 1-like [Triticum aestivum]XP_044416712.1 amino acid permease 1-like [Triticum aestivum]